MAWLKSQSGNLYNLDHFAQIKVSQSGEQPTLVLRPPSNDGDEPLFASSNLAHAHTVRDLVFERLRKGDIVIDVPLLVKKVKIKPHKKIHS